MKERELLVLRHGKSSWDSDAITDHDRPLARRGRMDAERMGQWLAGADLVPDCLISSTARRGLQTARTAAEAMGIPAEAVLADGRVYDASLRGLMTVLAEVPAECRRVLIVGHNPGLETLVSFLAGAAASAYETEKFFPTCALAVFRTRDDWTDLTPETAKLIELVRPKSLPD